MEIDGDKGKIVIEGNNLEFTELEVGEKEFNATNKKFMPKIPSKKIVKKMSKFREAYMHLFEQHTGIIRNFTNHVLNGDKLIAPGYEGIRGLTISNAIHLSSWLGEAVELPIDEEAYIAELNKRIEKENNK